ncbi:MAG: type IV secretion protein IcmD [Rickettsiella sp.]|nr:type IV secretion protein IcmD [Rickettsiella sp.]
MKEKKNDYRARFFKIQRTLFAFIIALITGSYAAITYAEVKTLGQMALTITYSFYGLSKLITAGAYMAGMGFVMASMLKFKAHKDNPTQIPIGTPIALLFVGSALIFLPHIFIIAGETVFGDTNGAAGIYGTTGLSIN